MVLIATPNHTHAAVLADAFATEKHILVEKPLCTTIEDARTVADDRHPGLFFIGVEYRYMPPVARLPRWDTLLRARGASPIGQPAGRR